MPQDEYSVVYSEKAKQGREALPDSVRVVLFKIADDLTANPDQFPALTEEISENIYIYKHPKPPIEITYVVDRQKLRVVIKHIVAPKFEVARLLFISYSHKDEQWLQKLKPFLQELEHNKVIQLWDDKEIRPSQEWKKEIDSALSSAKAAVLLVSKDFLASKFITEEELPYLDNAAQTRGLNIFWVLLSKCELQDHRITKYQAILNPEKPLDSIDNPNEANQQLVHIYEKIRDVLSS